MAELRGGDPRRWQTLLFVPADRPDMLAKAPGRGADAIVVDLEDAIAPASKAAARAGLATHLREGRSAGASAVCVRINAVGEGAEEDLAALAGCRLDAVMVPKAATAAGIELARKAIDVNLDDGESTGLIPQVESVRGILGLESLVATARLSGVAFGGEDFCVDLGVARSDESLELLVPRALLALHARDAGLLAIDTVFTAIGDEAGLVREATIARQLGFSGKLLIHPAQVEPVRRIFAPSDEELDWARRVLATQADGGGEEVGVHVVDGKMVDAPVVAQAQRILARAG
jgi:citrate lyase subunit beta/citryl-CoA lyase